MFMGYPEAQFHQTPTEEGGIGIWEHSKSFQDGWALWGETRSLGKSK